MINRIWLAIPVLAAMLLSACGSVKIGRLRAEPYRFQNRTVRVEGNVTKSVGAIVAGVYEVQDDTGKIYVLSNGGVPPKGSRVKLEGTLINGINVGSLSIGTAIRERNHRVKF